MANVIILCSLKDITLFIGTFEIFCENMVYLYSHLFLSFFFFLSFLSFILSFFLVFLIASCLFLQQGFTALILMEPNKHIFCSLPV